MPRGPTSTASPTYSAARDLLVNLAGRSVSCRYNKRNADDIFSSRVENDRTVGSRTGPYAEATLALDECQHWHDLPRCAGPTDGREERRAG